MEVPGTNNLSDEEPVTLGAPHPGLSVFQLSNRLIYFNKEFILKEEFEEDDIILYLEEKNASFAIEKIFKTQMALFQKPAKPHDQMLRDTMTTCQSVAGGEIRSLLSKHAQLIKRFRLDISLADDSDMDSSICLSLSSSATSISSKCQEDVFQDVSICSAVSLDDASEMSADLVSLFWLMSILPEPQVSKCKQVMDLDQFAWKISLYDVILVLLNWGATLQSLGMDEILNMPSSLFSPHLSPPDIKHSCPTPSNVVLVLNSISERLPLTECPRFPDSHKALLVKVLVYAALDQGHRRFLTQYCRTICSVLDSCFSWNSNVANAIVDLLKLESVGLQNSVFVCCSLFNMSSSRLSLVGSLASHNVLHTQFGLPVEYSFPNLIQHLLYPPELFNKFKIWHVYIITCHLHSLLVRSACQTPPCSKDVVGVLQQWTVEVRNALTQYPFMYTLTSSHVRERLSRLTAECGTIIRTMYNNPSNKTYGS